MPKKIYFAENDYEESILIADDEAEALSLLGGGMWFFREIGTANEVEASDVFSRVNECGRVINA